MSRLLDHIQVRKTGPDFQKLRMVTVEQTSLQDCFDYNYTYRVRATLGAELFVSALEVNSMTDEQLEHQLRAKVYRPLAEEVFGEYRKPLVDAVLAVHQGDSSKAIDLINSVLDSMFKVK